MLTSIFEALLKGASATVITDLFLITLATIFHVDVVEEGR